MINANNPICKVNIDLENAVCQFHGEHFTGRVFPYAGEHYCIFHLPVGDKDAKYPNTAELEELTSLRKGKTKLGGNWHDLASQAILSGRYDYVIDDQPFSLIVESSNHNLSFVGAKLGGLTIEILKNCKRLSFDFDEAELNGDVKIEAQESSEIDKFKGKNVIFNQNFIVSMQIIAKVDFYKAKFKEDTIFQYQIDSNPRDIIIKDSWILEDCEFKNTKFEHLHFKSNCEFRNTIFSNNALFNVCKFSEGVNFINCEIGQLQNKNNKMLLDCEFKKVFRFFQGVLHNDTELKLTLMHGSEQNGMIQFHDVDFKQKLYLTINYNPNPKHIVIRDIEFISSSGNNQLAECAFEISKESCQQFVLKNYQAKGDIYFKKNIFQEGISSNKVIDKFIKLPVIDFTRTQFHATLSLQGIEFTGKANFSDCMFLKAPLFHNSIFHPDTIFPQRQSFKEITLESENAYQTIYVEMARLKKRQYEGIFHALTQACHRKWLDQQPNISCKIKYYISYLYDFISEYGLNYLRPLIIIVLMVFVVFPIFYSLPNFGFNIDGSPIGFSLRRVLPYPILNEHDNSLQLISNCRPNSNTLTKTSSLFIEQFDTFHHPLSISRNVFKEKSQPMILEDCTRMSYFRWVGVIESVAFSILFAIFILALRWNFKRD